MSTVSGKPSARNAAHSAVASLTYESIGTQSAVLDEVEELVRRDSQVVDGVVVDVEVAGALVRARVVGPREAEEALGGEVDDEDVDLPVAVVERRRVAPVADHRRVRLLEVAREVGGVLVDDRHARREHLARVVDLEMLARQRLREPEDATRLRRLREERAEREDEQAETNDRPHREPDRLRMDVT